MKLTSMIYDQDILLGHFSLYAISQEASAEYPVTQSIKLQKSDYVYRTPRFHSFNLIDSVVQDF